MNRTCMNQQMMRREGQCPSQGMMRREGQCPSQGMMRREGQCSSGEMMRREQRKMEHTPCQKGEGRIGERTGTSAVPTGSRTQLLDYINEVSFAVYEALLYLDTHPDDGEAMNFFHEHNQKREHAMREYARMYGPLTISTADDNAGRSWEWMCQPWPWEGGDC